MDCPFYTALSPIHGRGLFSNRYIPCGTVLLKVSDKQGNITSFAKWINHSWNPNIMLHEESDGWYAVSTQPIYPAREIIGNYNFSPDCIENAEKKW